MMFKNLGTAPVTAICQRIWQVAEYMIHEAACKHEQNCYMSMILLCICSHIEIQHDSYWADTICSATQGQTQTQFVFVLLL